MSMKNIKTIELTESVFGLPAGSVLTRLDNESPFEYKDENVGDSFVASHHVTVGSSMINNSFARAIEWFEPRRKAKEVISELEGKIALLTKENEMFLADIKKYNELLKRIDTKRSEFEVKLNELEQQLEDDLVAGESIEWADEAMTVYYNLIDLLKKLTA